MRILLFCVASDALKTRVLLRMLTILFIRVLLIDAFVSSASASELRFAPTSVVFGETTAYRGAPCLDAIEDTGSLPHWLAERSWSTHRQRKQICQSGTQPVADEMVTFGRPRWVFRVC